MRNITFNVCNYVNRKQKSMKDDFILTKQTALYFLDGLSIGLQAR